MADTFRAMCAELLRRWDAANGDHDLIDVADAMDRTRTLLAQREPEAPIAWGNFLEDGTCVGLSQHLEDITRWLNPKPLFLSVPPELAQPEPEGPTDEEWDALVTRAWDQHETVGYQGERFMYDSDFGNALDFVRRELARWGHPAPQPVAVSERLPEPSVKVLAHYFNALGKGRTICAIWVPAKSRSDEGDLDSNDLLEYDEENDKYHWPEGWYEAIENWDDIGWAMVYEGEVAYWQPLPKWPANALPTPEDKP